MIYEIRGVQVMLDSDLAELFGYETKNLNRQVQRNIERFPNDFCFQLTKKEYDFLRCQNVTFKSPSRGKYRKYLPYAFTEHGIIMLSSLLKSNIAIEMSIKIVKMFIAMRKYLSNNLLEYNHYKNILLEDHDRISLLEQSLDKLSDHQKESSIFFEVQIFDAYIFLLDLLSKAKEEIIIIDNYAEKELFRIIKDIKVKVIIISKDIEPELIKKYQRQYTNVDIKLNNSFHDRFIIIDRKVLYHSGASFKDLGKKCFAMNLIEDHTILEKLLSEINI